MPAPRPFLVPLIAAAVPLFALPAQQRRPLPAPAPPIVSGTITSVTIQQRMIIRVPRLPVGRTPTGRGAPSAPPQSRWKEKKAAKCVELISLAAAAVTTPDSVDLLLNGGKRLRARFGSECPAIDFYSGFYVKMTKDGKVCAGRDSIRARSGGECQIRQFRTLEPAK